MPQSTRGPRIIVALDVDDLRQAERLLEQLDPKHCRLKVGKGTFIRFGSAWVEKWVKRGFDVFLDLKFHDIPHQVALACRAAADIGVWMLTLHAQGGRKMLEAARHALEQQGGPQTQRPLLVAVTLLTSLNGADLAELGLPKPVSHYVQQLALLSQDAGLDGAVCSPQEASLLRETCGQAFYLVTPGIRLRTDTLDDQQRTATPQEAIKRGADFLVIGRSITQSANPVGTLQAIESSLD